MPENIAGTSGNNDKNGERLPLLFARKVAGIEDFIEGKTWLSLRNLKIEDDLKKTCND
jgi:hypothetical protein